MVMPPVKVPDLPNRVITGPMMSTEPVPEIFPAKKLFGDAVGVNCITPLLVK